LGGNGFIESSSVSRGASALQICQFIKCSSNTLFQPDIAIESLAFREKKSRFFLGGEGGQQIHIAFSFTFELPLGNARVGNGHGHHFPLLSGQHTHGSQFSGLF